MRADHEFLDLLDTVVSNGVYREGRNGGTYGLFGDQLRFDLSKEFPVLTTKYIHFHSVVTELLWFIKGDTNIKYLNDHGVTIWDEWADKDGNLGPVYGLQWRDFGGVDQLREVIEAIKSDPYSRRHVVSAWNPPEIEYMALPPCHILFQFYVAEGRLSLSMYQRSADIFLGLPFNIASYGLLLLLVARETGLKPGDLIISLGDVHLYANHVDQAQTQLERDPLPAPFVHIEPDISMFDLEPGDITLLNYNYHQAIRAPVSV